MGRPQWPSSIASVRDHGCLIDAKLHGDCVGGLEADATNVTRQPVGVLGHYLNGIGAVGLVDAHRPRRANAMAMQEHHDLTNDLLLCPGSDDAARPHRANATHFPQSVGLRLDHVEHLLAEGAQQFLGIDRANAADHARGQVLLDAFDRSGLGRLEEPRLKLLAVRPVVHPLARSRDPFAGANCGGMANDGDQLAVATRLSSQNAKTVLGIVKSDALDQSGQHLLAC
jgi:hypothetical protein